MLQRSRETSAFVFYPRAFHLSGDEGSFEWTKASGKGVVYAATTICRKPERGGDFNISIVELAEGPRLTTRVLGIAPSKIAIGMRVVARIEAPTWRAPRADERVVVFYPESQK